MSVPTFETISTGYVIATAKLELGLFNSTLDDALLRNYMTQGMKEINTWLTFENKIATITIDCARGELPCDFVKLVRKNSVYISSGSEGYAVQGVSAFFEGEPSGSLTYCSTPYQIIDNYIVFDSDADVDEVMIGYLGVRTDEDGNALIPSSHERLLVSYMKWKYSQTYFDKYPANLRAEFQREFAMSKRYRRGQENEPDAGERSLIASIMLRMNL